MGRQGPPPTPPTDTHTHTPEHHGVSKVGLVAHLLGVDPHQALHGRGRGSRQAGRAAWAAWTGTVAERLACPWNHTLHLGGRAARARHSECTTAARRGCPSKACVCAKPAGAYALVRCSALSKLTTEAFPQGPRLAPAAFTISDSIRRRRPRRPPPHHHLPDARQQAVKVELVVAGDGDGVGAPRNLVHLLHAAHVHLVVHVQACPGWGGVGVGGVGWVGQPNPTRRGCA